jgi:hypothetical protein
MTVEVHCVDSPGQPQPDELSSDAGSEQNWM